MPIGCSCCVVLHFLYEVLLSICLLNRLKFLLLWLAYKFKLSELKFLASMIL